MEDQLPSLLQLQNELEERGSEGTYYLIKECVRRAMDQHSITAPEVLSVLEKTEQYNGIRRFIYQLD